MIDREKVIKAIEICYTFGHNCTECPLFSEDDCNDKLMHNVLVLLKEQEAVEPKKIKGYNPPMYTLYEYECEECKTPMMNKQPFCMGCGKPVKWK